MQTMTSLRPNNTKRAHKMPMYGPMLKIQSFTESLQWLFDPIEYELIHY